MRGSSWARVSAAAAVGFSKTSKTPSDFAGVRLGQLDQLRLTSIHSDLLALPARPCLRCQSCPSSPRAPRPPLRRRPLSEFHSRCQGLHHSAHVKVDTCRHRNPPDEVLFGMQACRPTWYAATVCDRPPKFSEHLSAIPVRWQRFAFQLLWPWGAWASECR